ncbi:hypothetical protein CDL12_10938 [Handroanthus impetiginosus]|uniref:Uncharacterized protein n=1 Tax=Handroanthus impetiginosus TaxID=429701 RepID=A0A2G9HFU6_9LAMI|nr:hypothetical protein CDL12_10938 [Handroanthus impetiginosus]
MNESKARACRRPTKNPNEGDHAKEDSKKLIHSFRSVTDFKTNGIHFKPSQTQSLKDVKFESKWIYGKFYLPMWFVSLYTKAFFLNMIAYELSPNNSTEGIVTTYIKFMKSLIVNPGDVKELRESRVLFCTLGSDKQVLKVFQDLNTYGADNPYILKEVKDELYHEINKYYRNKLKRWTAEFIQTYFRSPWSVVALVATVCILILTFLQTVYTMKSNFHEK